MQVIAEYPDYQLTKIFTTHKHMDHAGGNDVIYEQFPDVDIIGGTIDQVLCCRTCVNDGDVITFGNLKVHVLHTPGHTNGHICYFIPAQPGCDTPAVFTGDTLFIGGCGKFFEGTGTEMYNSLKKLTALPSNTEVYCGHEYTASNYRFALSINPSNAELVTVNDAVAQLRFIFYLLSHLFISLFTHVIEHKINHQFHQQFKEKLIPTHSFAHSIARWLPMYLQVQQIHVKS